MSWTSLVFRRLFIICRKRVREPELTIETTEIRPVKRGVAKVAAVFSYRYDAQLVPGLIENISPSVHAWVGFDDRAAVEAMSNEPARRNVLLNAARAIGAEWILAVDPDERFEIGLEDRITQMTNREEPALWNFAIRELFLHDSYRIDGLWGGKKQMRLFPANASNAASGDNYHGGWVKLHSGLRSFDSGLNLYHLRHILPARRQHRRDTYAAADPDRRFQKIGYDYLVDERSMVLEAIAKGRGYFPHFAEDGEVWGPPIQLVGAPIPDSQGQRLRYASVIRRRRGAGAAHYVLSDLIAADPDDQDLPLVATQLSHEARNDEAVKAEVAALLNCNPAQALPLFIRAKSRLAQDDRIGAHKDAVAAARIFPAVATLDLFWRGLDDGIDRFAAKQALWRRWAGNNARLIEGPAQVRSEMAVVVLGYKAPVELKQAVMSLLEQSVRPEIIVVNSGGGNVCSVLDGLCDRIRVITTENRLFVGAARNVGIDASSARYVAFLAADCQAKPGWVAGRLAAHASGALAVSSPVVPDRSDNLSSLAANAILHRRRNLTISVEKMVHYGLSYDRSIFADFGYFAPALRVGEDTDLNDRIAERTMISAAPGVTTTHRYPNGLGALCRDMMLRGKRRASHSPYTELREDPKAWRRVWQLARKRFEHSLEAANRSDGLGQRRSKWLGVMMVLAVASDSIGIVITLRRMRQAARHLQKGRALLTCDPVGAIGLIRRATRLDPQSWHVFLALGEALFAQPLGPDHEQGIIALKRAHALSPRQPAPVVALCNALTKNDRLQEALDVADLAITRAPDVWQYWLKASTISLRLGRNATALFFAQGALVQSPAGFAAHKTLLAVHKVNRNLKQVKKRQQSCLSIDPNMGKGPRV
jgi:tetratricopeptide (TPR) repeat protein